MTTDFERAHAFTALHEGGYVNHPNDPGGETNLGVTRRVWEAWCKEQKLPVKAMRTLTPADVLPLYQARYWQPLAAQLPWPLSAAVYDMSVNHGVGDGNPDDEGGNEDGATYLLWRVHQTCPRGTPLQQALAACDAREEFFRAIVRRRPASQAFLKGWLRRVNAQRIWLQANAEPLTPEVPGVFLTDMTGRRALWDGRPTIYAGAPLNPEYVAALRIVCPPGTAATIGQLSVTGCADGALILARI